MNIIGIFDKKETQLKRIKRIVDEEDIKRSTK
jgi:hypothetical protein